ncbi:cysteine hydrolase family protein [Gracilibacillus dipsosauri]|uniref:Isochorismatase n=1 Tax=Gracilibacillus dipsosauri TaxID=178340 RepID=A0A317KU67_9BACI|nr:isochorismatase family cysteine hydrolase [Gracilibacillus dipsosauri]PWU67101.1 isochorismatase [Gracilibacillus dipsosauri]
MAKRALINVDYTVDFIASNGALTCGEPGQAIEAKITEITKSFMDQKDLTIFAVDVHEEGDPYHPETNLFPPHNIRRTKGRDLYGSLKAVYEANKQQNHVYYIDKTRYSAFAGTNLELLLRERGIKELHLIGVCTDICILHTAVDAYNKGFDMVIYQDAVASFNQAGHEWALGHFAQTLGAKVKEFGGN